MPVRTLVVLLALGPLAGCYLLETTRGQFELNERRVPIATLLAEPGTPAPLKARLELATRLRDFASRELGLPDNSSYRAYADVGRPYVVWNVVAAPEFSVDPKTWCFPVAGCVAYRGYFAEARARRFALGLESRGYDVAVGGVPAYSTLGHFADPVLNTMLGWDESELAALVFHELGHQLLYVKNDTAFNEAFATVVENEGVRRWLAATGNGSALREFQERAARYAEVAALVAEARARLKLLYARRLPPAQMRALKAEELARLKADYAARRAQLGPGYEWLFGANLNNALLASVATYQDCVPGLEARLEQAGHDLPQFYAAARALAKLSASDRRAAVCVQASGGGPTATAT
ncbi:MAG TPA: aminopeptidase [Steroidobacteraceae bacterium]|nr:aminopeptidase [Steroidobacteraceae bacterium]